MSIDPEYLAEFVQTWLVHNATAWPDGELYRCCHNDPERAWELIRALVEQDLDDSQMSALGAGPIEDLMRSHGGEFIDRLEALAATNETFRECLKRSYPKGPNNEIQHRMGIASGVSWVDYSSPCIEISPVLVRYNRQWGLRAQYERGRFLGMSVTDEADDPELADLGLRSGDLIISANGRRFSSPTRAREILTKISDPRTLRLEVIRDEQELLIEGKHSRAGT